MTAEAAAPSATAAAAAASPGGRLDAIDLARGAALIGMALYHLSWDLATYRLAPPALPFSPPMRFFSHVVASAFLMLVGVSLALAHRDGVRWRAFGRRLAVVAAAAALVTAASSQFAPEAMITFGILHCIAVASVVALPFVRLAPLASLIVGAIVVAAPFVARFSLFDAPALMWIGLGDALPNTLDWRPLTPWGGEVLIGLGLAKVWLARGGGRSGWRARGGAARALIFAGRHSLVVYLVHQPILIGLVYALAAWTPLAAKPDDTAFLAACQRACVETGRAAATCTGDCACVADVIAKSAAAPRLTRGALDAEAMAELKKARDACYGR